MSPRLEAFDDAFARVTARGAMRLTLALVTLGALDVASAITCCSGDILRHLSAKGHQA
jgi:hypothetical protein